MSAPTPASRGDVFGYGEATDRLARILFEELEHADPSHPVGWDDLSEEHRDIYREAIGQLLLSDDLLGQARAEQASRRSALVLQPQRHK